MKAIICCILSLICSDSYLTESAFAVAIPQFAQLTNITLYHTSTPRLYGFDMRSQESVPIINGSNGVYVSFVAPVHIEQMRNALHET